MSAAAGRFLAVGGDRLAVITLGRELFDDIVYAAYDGHDHEICGVLAGTFDETTTVVEAGYQTENVADRPEIRYNMDPEEQFEIIEELEADGHDLVGFYHSHPSGPTEPSKTDAARATWPGLSYVIIALDGYPYVGSWRWREDGFDQEIVRVR